MVHIFRNSDHTYDLIDVDEAVLISIIEGLQAQERRYAEDQRKPEFQGVEDQEFLMEHENALSTTIGVISQLIKITDVGQMLVFPEGTKGRMEIR